jgi:hypothetical protein
MVYRVARWFIIVPKIPIWAYLGEPRRGKCWYVLLPFGIFIMWFCLWSFGIFFQFGYVGTKKNLATLTGKVHRCIDLSKDTVHNSR